MALSESRQGRGSCSQIVLRGEAGKRFDLANHLPLLSSKSRGKAGIHAHVFSRSCFPVFKLYSVTYGRV
jgi:hypothetical protein